MLDAPEGQDNEQSKKPRSVRGPSKMPKERCVVTEVSPAGEPTAPDRVLGPFKTVCGIAVKDFVPISYRFWTGAQGDPHVVPNSIKNDLLWPKILEMFEFPTGTDLDVVKRKTLQTMGISFKNWKGSLNREFVQKGTTPDFSKWPKLADHWQAFAEYKLSEQAHRLSEVNKANSQKNIYPHKVGSRGYAKKERQWQVQLDRLRDSGVTPETEGWSDRSTRFLLGRGASFSDDGSLCFSSCKDQEVTQTLAKKLAEAHEQSAQGSFKPDRDRDELTLALGNKEHGGRTRGVGVMGWKYGFPGDAETYKSRKRSQAERDAEQQSQQSSMMQMFEERLQRERQHYQENQARMIAAAVQASPRATTGAPL